MIAVYYNMGASPFTMFVLAVKSADHGEFLDLLEAGEDYPFPDGDVVFIDNNEVIDQWHPVRNKQKSF